MKNLMKLLNLPYRSLASITLDSDGNYLGMEEGDIGYNIFFGKPNIGKGGIGDRHMIDTWRGFTLEEKGEVTAEAIVQGIPLHTYLIKAHTALNDKEPL
jgi:hypothetical protein